LGLFTFKEFLFTNDEPEPIFCLSHQLFNFIIHLVVNIRLIVPIA